MWVTTRRLSAHGLYGSFFFTPQILAFDVVAYPDVACPLIISWFRDCAISQSALYSGLNMFGGIWNTAKSLVPNLLQIHLQAWEPLFLQHGVDLVLADKLSFLLVCTWIVAVISCDVMHSQALDLCVFVYHSWEYFVWQTGCKRRCKSSSAVL